MEKKSVVLIGMPSSGKTTIGQPLAERLGKIFVDTDAVIKDREGKRLRDIINQDGLQRFLDIQEEVLLELEADNHVISTGGSVIYGHRSMMHMKEKGTVIYLKIALEELEKRIAPDRRFARNNGQTFADIYNERMPLYEKYADIKIECDDKSVEELVDEIIEKLK